MKYVRECTAQSSTLLRHHVPFSSIRFIFSLVYKARLLSLTHHSSAFDYSLCVAGIQIRSCLCPHVARWLILATGKGDPNCSLSRTFEIGAKEEGRFEKPQRGSLLPFQRVVALRNESVGPHSQTAQREAPSSINLQRGENIQSSSSKRTSESSITPKRYCKRGQFS